jgi:hypothetical protein
LSTIVRDHSIKTQGRAFNLEVLMQKDSLRRITDNFETIELKPKGGYITVSRNINKLKLSEKEAKRLIS